ncbi:LD-carboxypeptidase [Schaalia sp. 19OD2882]|uniref:LD-carboxypeptidase n=1 Tax=Schaalia sp. 19OD2882 TaxID=2794089 RepID=UPI001C1ED8A1|nr:LD-carboxypeptidase [Schaalia sp. 19OD2882]QWW18861.1 LD-carboxypeptidase [Schaalia sp. 19OD2882]
MSALVTPPKSRPGDGIAVLSPSLAGPALGPQVHDQAMRRLEEATGLLPVEFPTTRDLRASFAARAADVEAALRDPDITAIIATVGGDDQVGVIGRIDPTLVREHPTTFLGHSDNTHLHHLWRSNGVRSYYGGSTMVHIGPGPAIDPVHLASLRAALVDGGRLEITEPGSSEDFGVEWSDPRALVENGGRTSTEPWRWAGEATVTGPTWGGCIETLTEVLLADRAGVAPGDLDGAVLLLESSEDIMPTRALLRFLRALGERGLLAAAGAVLFARPPVSNFDHVPSGRVRERMRAERYDTVVEVVGAYNPDAPVVCGVPFGHTKPQWILPHGGAITVDAGRKRLWADYD